MEKKKFIKAFVVDDNQEAVDVLCHMLERDYSVKVVGKANDAETAATGIVKTEPDLIFLDIELPTMSGLDFCSMIRGELKPETKIVFYTGHDKYMLDAIRQQAFDYLLKPPTDHDLSQIMTRFYEDKLIGIPSVIQANKQCANILVVNAMNEHVALQLDNCAFFRYNKERKMWELVCMDNSCYALRHRTTSDVILNYSPDLVQIHKRYIVNTRQIKMIQDSICILTEPFNNSRELRISKNYRPQLMAAFYSL